MKRLLLILFLFFVVESIAQKFESHQEDWQNPAIFEKGQNPPHAFHIPYSSPENAIQDLPKKCPNYQLLNGYWNFKWVEKTTDIPKDFWEEDHKLEEWDKIMVPSNWQMEGFGHPKFRNIAISFENDPPNVPDYYNPVGCYKRKFTIPEEWEEKEIMLRFEGIKSAAYVWVNGRQAGYNQGGFEPAEFNITPYVKKGENEI